MSRPKLRDYQVKAINEARKVLSSGKRAPILCAPTGAGKTTISSELIDRVARNGKRAIFLAHRKELIDQCSDRLDNFGLDHGIIKAGNKRVNNLPVQVASVQTLNSRIRRATEFEADLCVIDECHRATAPTYLKTLEAMKLIKPKLVTVGLTATPYRTDGTGLNHIFDSIVPVSSVRELTDLGHLVPIRGFTTPMQAKIKYKKSITMKDSTKEIQEFHDKTALIGDLVQHWKDIAEERMTVCFAITRRHGEHIQEAFKKAGITAGYVDGMMVEAHREDELAAYSAGKYKVMVNIGLLTEGWDLPPVSCTILARMTQSKGLYKQMVGRILRPDPISGKSDALILDHGGNIHRFGMPDEPEKFSLEGIRLKRGEKEENPPSVTTCENCFAVYSGDFCPACGHKPKKKERKIEHEDGELVEYTKNRIDSTKKAYMKSLVRTSIINRKNDMWAILQYKNRFDKWPNEDQGVKWNWKFHEGKKIRKPDISRILQEIERG